MTKKVAIIGAGASGLTALKVCWVEYGFSAWCFEKTHDLGGLWRYKRTECEGESSVMKSTVINTSKEMMAYSDFPPSAELPNFMHNRDVLGYFHSYAQAFNLMDRIRFNTEVVSIIRSDDYEDTGRWRVTTKNLKTGLMTVELYDALFACTGHHVDPYFGDIAGLNTFEGRVLHSHSYKDPCGYEDKRVVVVGIGNSGGDIAVELSRIAEKVYLVARRGSWVLNRIYDGGYPLDMVLPSRLMQFLMGCGPILSTAYIEHKANSRFDHEKYGLKPSHHITQQHPTINDELPNRIQCGSVIVKPAVTSIQSPNRVVFEDGSSVDNVDVIVLATGYSFGFPYLEDGKLLPVEDNRVNLYKQIFLPDLAHPETLAIIGCFQPLGALMPMSEMQARVTCELLKDKPSWRLPDRSGMYADIEQRHRMIQTRYVASRRHTMQLDYIQYMDELSIIIHAKPSFRRFLLTDPKLAWSILFGPCLPYQYRLQGPNQWPGAKDALQTVWDRVWLPTKRSKRTNIGEQCGCRCTRGCIVEKRIKIVKGLYYGIIFIFGLILLKGLGWL